MENKTIDIIFAKAKCGVWKERVRNGECSLSEFNYALGEENE